MKINNKKKNRRLKEVIQNKIRISKIMKHQCKIASTKTKYEKIKMKMSQKIRKKRKNNCKLSKSKIKICYSKIKNSKIRINNQFQI